jgi:hypothetical protein
MLAVQGLTLDIEKGNLLRLGRDGYILAACHGTRYYAVRPKNIMLHCKENPINVLPEKKLHGLRPNFHIHFICETIYIFPRSFHLFSCSRVCRLIVVICIL